MADTQLYKAIFTPLGKEIVLNAYSGGESVKIKYMGIGRGDTTTNPEGEAYIPEFGQTDLKSEWLQIEVSDLFIDPDNRAWLIAEGRIPEDKGGAWVREISLKDEQGRVLIVSSYPQQWKSVLGEGAASVFVVRVTMEVSDTEVFELTIDQTMALATVDQLNRHIAQTGADGVHNSSVAPTPNTIVVRGSTGNVKTGTPSDPDDAATQKQIEDVVSLIEQAGDSGVPLRAAHIADGTSTRYSIMGLLRDLPESVLVNLDGKTQEPSSYTLDAASPANSAVIFNTPPPAGVKIDILTVVALTQYPYATDTVAGVVRLATNTADLNERVPTLGALRSGAEFILQSISAFTSWLIQISQEAKLRMFQGASLEMTHNARINMSQDAAVSMSGSGAAHINNSAILNMSQNATHLMEGGANVYMAGTAQISMHDSYIQMEGGAANSTMRVGLGGNQIISMNGAATIVAQTGGPAGSIASISAGSSLVQVMGNAQIVAGHGDYLIGAGGGGFSGLNGSAEDISLVPFISEGTSFVLDGNNRVYTFRGNINIVRAVDSVNRGKFRCGDNFYFISSGMTDETAVVTHASWINEGGVVSQVSGNQCLVLVFIGFNVSGIPRFMKVS